MASDLPPGADRPDDDGLPEGLRDLLRGLTGGADVPPQLVEMLKGAGLDQADPAMLQGMIAQVQQLFAASNSDGPLSEELVRDVARRTAFDKGDPRVTVADSQAVADAVSVADLWLNTVTEIAAPGARGLAMSRSEWIEATMPRWLDLVEPVARGVEDAAESALGAQLGRLSPGDLPEGIFPPGTNPAAAMSQMSGVMRRIQGSMFSMQAGQGVGTLASDLLSGNEVGLPLTPAGDVVLLPDAVREFAQELDLDEPQVRLFLAVRELARVRLFADVPWLAAQQLAAVRDYAGDISIDTDAIEHSLGSTDLSDPAALQEALSGTAFAPPSNSPAQAAALRRLEASLALVEGWVDVVATAAARPHLPQVDALAEAVRRRRATGGPAEKTFSALVGLELRPRRLRDAANLFAALEAYGGAEARDAAWRHPDLAPGADDLDDPLGYVERSRTQVPDDMDAALEDLLRGESPGDARGDAPA